MIFWRRVMTIILGGGKGLAVFFRFVIRIHLRFVIKVIQKIWTPGCLSWFPPCNTLPSDKSYLEVLKVLEETWLIEIEPIWGGKAHSFTQEGHKLALVLLLTEFHKYSRVFVERSPMWRPQFFPSFQIQSFFFHRIENPFTTSVWSHNAYNTLPYSEP